MLRLQMVPIAALALVTAGFGLFSGCASMPDYNDADVTFASQMLPHHQQAVRMADLTKGRDLDPAFVELADGIRDAQEPEIATMTTWLKDWNKPVPSDSADSSDDESGDPDGSGDPDDMDDMDGMDMGSDMPGMMSAEQMQELEDAPDATFEKLWLELMIQHHEGAVDMADTEISGGDFPDAVALARHVQDSQSAEIEQMRAMLAQ